MSGITYGKGYQGEHMNSSRTFLTTQVVLYRHTECVDQIKHSLLFEEYAGFYLLRWCINAHVHGIYAASSGVVGGPNATHLEHGTISTWPLSARHIRFGTTTFGPRCTSQN
jgi:hypothetical protein